MKPQPEFNLTQFFPSLVSSVKGSQETDATTISGTTLTFSRPPLTASAAFAGNFPQFQES